MATKPTGDKAESTFRDLPASTWGDRYRAGDRNALFSALADCMQSGQPIPPWASVAFLESMGRIERYEVATLDEAFQWKRFSGKIDAERRFQERGWMVFLHCIDLQAARRRGESAPDGAKIPSMGDDFFAHVSADFREAGIEISSAIVKVYYDRCLKEHGRERDWWLRFADRVNSAGSKLSIALNDL